MQIRVGRILVAAVAVEVLAVLVLVVLVALARPSEPAAAEAYAVRLGYWVGPIAGFVLCVIGGWWVARGLATAHVINGLALGVVAAAIDVAILLASGTEFQPVFAVSNIGRIIAGVLGGLLAARSQASAR
jgi:hypothetical protein